MIIKSDILKFRTETEAMKMISDTIQKQLPLELMRIEADFVAQILYRVKFRALTANGVFMRTKSNTPMGAYGQRHGKARRMKGLRIDQVNLHYTGRMQLDFNLTEKSDLSIGIGFLSEESARKAEENEEYYGDEIFEPSDQEEIDTMNDAEVRLLRILEGII